MSDTKQNMKEGRWAPDECPITGKPFFLWLSHPEFGYVPTYGGPFDSFMIAEPDEDGYYRAEHYCHDRGDWIEGGTPVTVRKELTVTAEIEIAPTQGADKRCDYCGNVLAKDLSCKSANCLHGMLGAGERPVAIYQIRAGAYRWDDVTKDAWEDTVDNSKRIVYATRDAAPTRYGYVYEWDYSPGVVHRSFDCARYNGRQPDRTVEVFRAAIAPRGKTE